MTKSSETEEGTLNAAKDQQNQKTAGHFLVATGVVDQTPNALNYPMTQTTPGKTYDDYYQEEEFSQEMNQLDQYPLHQEHIVVDQDDTNDGLTTPDEMGDEYIMENGGDTWHEEAYINEAIYEEPQNVEDEEYIEDSQVNMVKDDSGSGLHTMSKRTSQKSFDQDTLKSEKFTDKDSEKDTEKESVEKKSEENSENQKEKQEPSETLDQIIMKQKGIGKSAADRWKSLRQTIDEKRSDSVSLEVEWKYLPCIFLTFVRVIAIR